MDLDLAREPAAVARKAIAQGRDPFAEKAAAKREVKETAKTLTFGAFVDDHIASVEAGWRNEKHPHRCRKSA